MKCKKCGAKLPDEAKFCDICGAAVIRETYEERDARETKEREADRKKRIIKRIAIAAGIVVVLIIMWELLFPKDAYYDPNLYGKMNRVSAEEYSRLSVGLSFKQVRSLLGRGYKYSKYGNVVIGGEYTYVWPGEYIEERLMDSEVKVIFNNRSHKVSTFSEHNVIDGKEIYENLSNGRRALSRRTREDIESIQEGMSYEELVNFMGMDGILVDSASNSDGSEEKEYVWHLYDDNYEKCKMTAHFFKGKLSGISID